MIIINRMVVLLFVILGGLILAPIASATPSQGADPNLMYPNTPTVLTIMAGTNFPHIATEIAMWGGPASPTFGSRCPLPGPSGGNKWDLKADVNNDGTYETNVGYNISLSGAYITITDFGDGGDVILTITGGATLSPASPTGGYAWVHNASGIAKNDATALTGTYEFASCGREGTNAGSTYVGTSTFNVYEPSTNLRKDVFPSKVHIGDEVTYTYYETNDGDYGIDLSQSYITDLFQPYVQDDTCSPVEYSSGDDGDTVLEVDEMWVYTCSMSFETAGVFTNTAIGHGIDLNGNDVTYPGYADFIFEDLDERATATVTVIDPAITLTKTPSSEKVLAGSDVTYTYVVTNTGDTSLTVTVSDDQYGIVYGPTVMAPQESASPTYTATIDETITNIATATGVDQLQGEVTAEARATVRTIDPAITLTKTPSSEKVLAGTDVTYTYVVANTGDTDLTVTVSDDQYGIVYGPTVLAAQTSATETKTASIGSTITNVATATGVDQFDGEVTAEARATVRTIDPAITVVKTCTPETQPEPGTIDWLITVANTGDVELAVVVTDSMHGVVFNNPIPAGESRTIPLQDSDLLAGDYTNTVDAVGTTQLGDVIASSEATCTVVVGTEGCTPGYWKNHPQSWWGYSPDQSLESVFDIPDGLGIDNVELIEALGFPGGKGVDGASRILLRAAVASLLNAANPEVGFTMSTADVISSVNDALATGDRTTILNLATELDDDNNLGCPLDKDPFGVLEPGVKIDKKSIK